MPRRVMKMRVEDVAIQAANRTTEAGAVTGFVGWLASVNWIGWAGVLIALGGLLANLYYQRRRDRRERTEHEARMRVIEQRCE
ncbi:MAG: holin [Corticimicrobacter sp.]|uniref:holin n=1 Tax=Corticimicrobacter sp. TaxID=2678536 RepID=UPI0032DB435B